MGTPPAPRSRSRRRKGDDGHSSYEEHRRGHSRGQRTRTDSPRRAPPTAEPPRSRDEEIPYNQDEAQAAEFAALLIERRREAAKDLQRFITHAKDGLEDEMRTVAKELKFLEQWKKQIEKDSESGKGIHPRDYEEQYRKWEDFTAAADKAVNDMVTKTSRARKAYEATIDKIVNLEEQDRVRAQTQAQNQTKDRDRDRERDGDRERDRDRDKKDKKKKPSSGRSKPTIDPRRTVIVEWD
jgi:hypothetical protein